MKVLVLNGVNLGRLGTREPGIYGSGSYADLVDICRAEGSLLGVEVDIRQTDDEGQLVRWLHEAADNSFPVALNAAAWTHYSVAVRDAAAQRTADLVEVHLSNPSAREEFRHVSLLTAVATGVVSGFGFDSYRLALQVLSRRRVG